MKIIAHRGLWNILEERNTMQAFVSAFKHGFGIETDIRDYRGDLVISHDIASENAIKLTELLDLYNSYQLQEPLALNIKSDGLQALLKKILEENKIKNYFVFDMSIPDTLGYLQNKIITYTRQSEYEPIPPLYKQCNGIWIDGFESDILSKNDIETFLSNHKQLALVSPELHKREYLFYWEKIKKMNLHIHNEVILCTDKPMEAKEYFNE